MIALLVPCCVQRLFLLALGGFASVASHASGQETCPVATLYPSGGPFSGQTLYGQALDLDGECLVVGAYRANVSALQSGVAFIYENVDSTWVEQLRVALPNAGQADWLGYAVALRGNLCAISAPQGLGTDISTSGFVLILRRVGTGWHRSQRLRAPDVFLDPATGQVSGFAFGASLAMDEQHLVIGALGDTDESGNNTGAAYVFDWSGEEWVFAQKLRPPGALHFDGVGTSMALRGGVLVIGAELADLPGYVNAGAAYVYRRTSDGWVFVQKLVASSPQALEGLAEDIVICADGIAVGAAGYDHAGEPVTDTGRVLFFRKTGDGWIESAQLEASPVSAGARFGVSLSQAGSRLFVGALGEQSATGRVYEFRREGGSWVPNGAIRPSGAPIQTGFGSSLDCSGGSIAIGARSDDVQGPDVGAVHVLPLAIVDCNETGWPDSCEIAGGFSADADLDGVPDECQLTAGTAFCLARDAGAACPCASSGSGPGGCAHSGGFGGELSATGVPSISSDSLVLRGSQLPTSLALYFQGLSSVAPVAFGDGQLCVGGTIWRLGIAHSAGGQSSWPNSGSTPISEIGDVVQPGDRYYQVWFRNPAEHCTPATFNLSNALHVVWTH